MVRKRALLADGHPWETQHTIEAVAENERTMLQTYDLATKAALLRGMISDGQ